MFQPVTGLTVDGIAAAYATGLDAIAKGQREIDLGKVTAVDSTAVAALVGWQRAARSHGRELAFVNMPANLDSLARLYGVADLLKA